MNIIYTKIFNFGYLQLYHNSQLLNNKYKTLIPRPTLNKLQTTINKRNKISFPQTQNQLYSAKSPTGSCEKHHLHKFNLPFEKYYCPKILKHNNFNFNKGPFLLLSIKYEFEIVYQIQSPLKLYHSQDRILSKLSSRIFHQIFILLRAFISAITRLFHNYFSKYMESSKTRSGQKQLMDFMVNAGCDPTSIHDQYSSSAATSTTTFKKPAYKQIQDTQQYSYVPQKHKKIHKPTKTTEKKNYKGKLPKHDIEYESQEYQVVKPINTQEKHHNPITTQQNKITQKQNEDDKSAQPIVQESSKSQFLFPPCINKANNNFYGYFGHATILVNQPIIQGSYYMQVDILNPSPPTHPKGKHFESHIRIGLCKINYRLLVPIGGQTSYCYKSKDGSILHLGSTLEYVKGLAFGPGDTVGVFLHMQPPYRYMKENNVHNIPNSGSVLSFYVNGKLSCELSNIDQCFYSLGVSLFNWANVKINLGPTFKYTPIQQAKPAQKLFEEECPYSDLKVI